MSELKTTILSEGQEYLDEPVYVFPKPITQIEASMAAMYGLRLPQPKLIGHDRVRLRWMKPDGKGGLIPR